MLAALLVPLIAVIIGTSLALLGSTAQRVLLPIRTFALAAVVVSVAIHLVPEAITTSGGWVLGAFAAGLWLPHMLARRRGPKGKAQHRRLASELGFLVVLVHQIGDGVALGAVVTGDHAGHSHWDVLLGILAHTIPLAAVVTLPFVGRGARHLAWRAALLIIASMLGVLGAKSLAFMHAEALPWLSAGVAGTLLHLLSHDEPALARPASARPLDVAAMLLGGVLPIAMAGEHEQPVLAALGGLTLALAPPLLVGLVGAIALRGSAGLPSPLRAPVLAAWLDALRAPSCACEVTEQVARRPRAPTTRRLAFLLAAPELHVGTVALTAWLFGPRWAALRLGLALAASWLVARLAGTPIDDAPDEPALAQPQALPWTDRAAETLVHAGPWLAAGLVVASWFAAATPAGWHLAEGQVGPGWVGMALVMAALSAIVYVCAWAATPAAIVLVGHGLPPVLAIAGLVIGSLSNRDVVVLLARTLGGRALAVLTATALAIAVAAALAVPVAPALSSLPAAPRWLELAAGAALAAAALFSLWRHGLTAWLEPLLSTAGGHHHHQHEETEPCGDGCHDAFAKTPSHGHDHVHDPHGHDHAHDPHGHDHHDHPHHPRGQ